MAVCVAILDKSSSPLKLTTQNPTRELAFHYIVHASLDVIEEKWNNSPGSHLATGTPGRTGNTEAPRELYLGLLYSTEQHKVFGYVTNTNIKFIIVVEASNASLRDNEIRQMFRKLRDAYTVALWNPFYTPGTTIESKKFDAVIASLMA